MPLTQGRVGKGSRHTVRARHSASNQICSIAKRTYGFCTQPGVRCVSGDWQPGAVGWSTFCGGPGLGWLWERHPFPPPRPHRSGGVSPKFSPCFHGTGF